MEIDVKDVCIHRRFRPKCASCKIALLLALQMRNSLGFPKDLTKMIYKILSNLEPQTELEFCLLPGDGKDGCRYGCGNECMHAPKEMNVGMFEVAMVKHPELYPRRLHILYSGIHEETYLGFLCMLANRFGPAFHEGMEWPREIEIETTPRGFGKSKAVPIDKMAEIWIEGGYPDYIFEDSDAEILISVNGEFYDRYFIVKNHLAFLSGCLQALKFRNDWIADNWERGNKFKIIYKEDYQIEHDIDQNMRYRAEHEYPCEVYYYFENLN